MNRRKFLRSAAAALATLFLPKRGKAAEPRYDTIGGKWWLFEDRDPVRPLTDIEAATVIWDTVGERDVVVDNDDADAESLAGWLESFDCGVTWEYKQSCEGKDWCGPAADWVPGPGPDLRLSDEQRDVAAAVKEEDCLIISPESNSGTVPMQYGGR